MRAAHLPDDVGHHAKDLQLVVAGKANGLKGTITRHQHQFWPLNTAL